jgi:PAS domain S-box-containing protein
VSHPETYISRHPGTNYFVDVVKLGDRILLVKASGYVRSYEMTEAMGFVDDYVSKHFDRETGVFYLEDYADVEGADPEARRTYIMHHKSSEIIWGGILYNLSLLFRISLNISKRLHVQGKYLGAAESYPHAVALAREVIRRRDSGDVSGRDHDLDFLTFLEKSSEKATQLYRHLTEGIQRFSRSAALSPGRKIRRQNTEALLRYIESIDWHVDGIKNPEGEVFSDPEMKQVAAAIAYIKSEMDDLLRHRAAMEKTLRESEGRYRRLVEHARAGILEFDYAAHRIVSVNDSFLAICGYSMAEIMNRAPEELMTESSRKLFYDRLRLRMEGKSLPDDAAYEFFTKNGEKKWVLLTANISPEGGLPQKADIIVIDITPIKEAEARLLDYQARLKALTVELSRTEERQRRDLASQLHEGASQELFAAQLKLASLKHSITDPGQLQRLDEVNTQIVKSIREIKSITYDLSPPVLYDLGLPEALESLAKTFETRHGLKVAVDCKGEGNCKDEIKHIIYRVVREVLQNTVKHARADRASVFMEKTDEDLFVDVTDNGIGFDTSVVAENHYNNEGFGLFDIREKIHHLGGDLRICSTSGEGTRVSLAVPLNPA